jgi:hypothetical protein
MKEWHNMEYTNLKDKSLTELKEIAKEIGLTGVSKCNKGDLIKLITKSTVGVDEGSDSVATANPPVIEKKKVYELMDIISVVSLVKNGGLTFIDFEGTQQRWEAYGDEVDLTYKDIRLMKTRNKRFFEDCWVKIPDDVATQLRIKDYLAGSKIRPENIDNAFLLKPDDFYDALLGSTDGVQKLVVDTAVEKLRNEDLYDMRIMRIIKKITNQDIEELAKFMDFGDAASDRN